MFFGGISIKKDEDTLRNNCPHIVVGTPGRLLALVRQKILNLKNIKHFILDECDKMLEQLGKKSTKQCSVKPLTVSSFTYRYASRCSRDLQDDTP